ncbi:GNAT family N-acetyltransferase [Mycetocola reblochoni]|uniref:Ribosomal-protein-alanine acetyltransferase n=2 Tax=Mycetocola reblochoni TaxID=331618 RepID=A0A1R4IUA3_9MICO|nr:GNAT family N-acetyltransferase [Mycetocola reblochoni]RLP71029.1 N-acetyltransferase [Mycetocola reblochoni]SJN23457.1 Ribosomal-protein-alanine acetyltransferase [Mycetocola reblochoni REB411]
MTATPGRTVRTQRLLLAPLRPEDADDVFTVYADARTWRHLPSGRFTAREQAVELIDEARASAAATGLGPWAVRLLDDTAQTSATAPTTQTAATAPTSATTAHPPASSPQGPPPAAVRRAASGRMIGTGGVRLLAEPAVWNLGYRLSPDSWGRGLATELARAALAAADALHPELPVTARAISDNRASTAVLDRLGLGLIWEGRPPSAPGSLRRVYSDRPLSSAATEWLIRHA